VRQQLVCIGFVLLAVVKSSAAQAFQFDHGDEQSAKPNPYQPCAALEQAILHVQAIGNDPQWKGSRKKAIQKAVADSVAILRAQLSPCGGRARATEQATQDSAALPFVTTTRAGRYRLYEVSPNTTHPELPPPGSGTCTRAVPLDTVPAVWRKLAQDSMNAGTLPYTVDADMVRVPVRPCRQVPERDSMPQP
jgi:hypothetical protein